ncbi:MAG TPA: segregation/condensation protein A [Hellea balneolensis]|uniref:Segregation and condensation protein A n=1 Tax=Hellea balneolensis TaxID=287478 RepID=A0A7C5M1T4_9PROT|nr:segregation/condensation protein A [Hellea balneolensis]
MSDDFQGDLAFEAADDAADEGVALILDIDGFEGPLHLLLELARMQKVDLARISILELAEQYITFIKTAKDLRIELKADYLVMASWLAYLKSRLILPKTEGEDQMPEAEELAAHLAFRLQRLEIMRRAAEAFFKLKVTGQNIFVRGAPEGLRSRTTPLYQAELFDMIKAYGEARSQATIRNIKLKKPLVLALDEARHRLERAMGTTLEWMSIEDLLPAGDDFEKPLPIRSIRASSLLAGLELAKEGVLEIKQTQAFAPIYLRKTKTDGKPNDE